MSVSSISRKADRDENKDKVDDWSEKCLAYLFNNKIWFPDFVR